jgi:two-component system LytT family response regulator
MLKTDSEFQMRTRTEEDNWSENSNSESRAKARTRVVETTERIAIKSGRRIAILRIADIAWVKAGHNNVEIHTDEKAHVVRSTLGVMEQRLRSDMFVRISRSVIINLEKVKELEPLLHGSYTVTLQNGRSLTLSRRYRGKLPLLGLQIGSCFVECGSDESRVCKPSSGQPQVFASGHTSPAS